MATICRDLRLLFIQAPRTGCSAVEKMLLERFGGESLPSENILNADGFVRVQRKHCTLQQLTDEGLIPADFTLRNTTVTTVRNPFDSLVSFYVKKREGYQSWLTDPDSWVHKVRGYVEDMEFCRTHSFDEWLHRKYAVNRIDRLLGKGRRSLYGRYTHGVAVIMRFERLQQDFEHLMRGLGVEADVTIPKINPTRHRKGRYQDYYTPEARKLVEYVFKPDMDRYGYAFDHEQQDFKPLRVGTAR